MAFQFKIYDNLTIESFKLYSGFQIICVCTPVLYETEKHDKDLKTIIFNLSF